MDWKFSKIWSNWASIYITQFKKWCGGESGDGWVMALVEMGGADDGVASTTQRQPQPVSNQTWSQKITW